MNSSKRKFLIAATWSALLASPSLTRAQRIVSDSKSLQKYNHPGGVVDLSWPKTTAELPIVKYGLSEPIVLDLGSSWRCLIGLDIDTLPGEYVVYVKDSDSELPAFALRFTVEQKVYAVVSTDTPSGQIAQQPTIFSEVDFVNSVPPELPLILPVDIEWEDTFGTVFVDEKQSERSTFVHQRCLVLRRATLSDQGALVVVAPQNGIVSKLEPSPNRLNSDQESMLITIDHGRGLYTALDGIRDVTVKSGNGIVRGAVIGKVQREQDSPSTASRRSAAESTNQELVAAANDVVFRWYCVLNGAFVNPIILTKLS